MPGAEGSISQAEAEALRKAEVSSKAKGAFSSVRAPLSGLAPATTYAARLVAEWDPEFPEGSGERSHKVATSAPGSFTTAGSPTAATFTTHGLRGESVRLLGWVDPNSVSTSEEQSIAIEGAPTGGTFTLGFNGDRIGGSTTGTVTTGSSTITGIPLPPVKGTGNVIKTTDIAQSEVTGIVTSVGHFESGQPISGPGIPPGDSIQEVRGTALRLTERPTETVSGAALTSTEAPPFTFGEAIAGAGIPAGTTITGVRTEPDFTASLAVSAAATETKAGVPLSVAIPYDAPAETVLQALKAVGLETLVEGLPGGPYTVVFLGGDAGTDEPRIEADGSGLRPSGSVSVATLRHGGEAQDTHYHFEYITEAAFAADSDSFGAGTESTPSVDLGAGDIPTSVGADLLGVQAGEAYRYRISATSTLPGNPVVHGEEHTLTVPEAPPGSVEPLCTNSALRSGLSSHLPDCRAFEQISPVDKEGAQEVFNYAGALGEGTVSGEDGNHFMFMSTATRWGSGPEAGQAPYFFTREEGKGWQMTAATPQPEAGFDKYSPKLFTSDLTQFAFSSAWSTNEECSTSSPSSKQVEYRAGPPGGPYATVAAVPCKDLPSIGNEGWVAASPDFSKLILGAQDHSLLGPTGTTSGMDLYEYSAGQLHQLNVDSAGRTIGACGASIAKGFEETMTNAAASAHTVSTDGSRVFFEAVPGRECSEPKHLYVRVNGSETVDIGAYRFIAANPEGTELLLGRHNGEATELLRYEAGSSTLTPLFTVPASVIVEGTTGFGGGISVSRDFTAIYVFAQAQLTPDASAGSLNVYRYEIATGPLRFVVPLRGQASQALYARNVEVSPDGRFLFFSAREVGGLPGGGGELTLDGSVGSESSPQLYRYDSTEDVVECVSCASPFDPEPRLGIDDNGGAFGSEWPTDGVPHRVFTSADGNYAFFETPARLLPQDANGEQPPNELVVEGLKQAEPNATPSNDVYEWRRVGVDGCAAVQGCVNLITPGTDGHLVSLLGASETGQDVFFYTSSQLAPQDNDNAGDFYDARVGGGFPEPVGPVECEGDACSSTSPAPVDLTPASATFQGAENVLGAPLPAAKPTPKSKPKPKLKRCKRRAKKRCPRQARKTAGRAAHGRSGRKR